MPYSPGFSITAASEGAKAMGDIVAAPAETEARTEKAAYEAGRYKALQETMKPKTPGESGIAHYDTITLGGQLQQRKVQLEQRKADVAKLAPEDQTKMDVSLDREQKEIDGLEAKLLKQSEGHLGEQYAILSHVTDEKSLQGARQYARTEIEAIADAAIKDKKIDPSNREQFINDRLNAFLPEKYDDKGKAQIDVQRNSSLSIAEQIKNKQAENQHIQALAAMTKATAVAEHQAFAMERTAQSADLKTLAVERAGLYNAVQGNNAMINEQVKELASIKKEMGTMPDNVSAGLFSGSEPNPAKVELKSRADDLQNAINGLQDANKPLITQLATITHKTKGVPAEKETEKAKPGSSPDNPIILE